MEYSQIENEMLIIWLSDTNNCYYIPCMLSHVLSLRKPLVIIITLESLVMKPKWRRKYF